MSLILPKNAQGQPANPDNEAHMLAVHIQAHDVLITAHNVQTSQAGRDAVMLKWQSVVAVGLNADDKARRGDLYWRGSIEHNGKTILDCWDGANVIYPQIINHSNASSKYSFLLYLKQALMDTAFFMPNIQVNLFTEIDKAVAQVKSDKHWIINSLDELVG